MRPGARSAVVAATLLCAGVAGPAPRAGAADAANAGTAGSPRPATTAAGSAPAGTSAALRNDCPLPSDAFLRAKLAGGVNRTVDWRAGEMQCEGMRRPDGRGLRVTFRGRLGDEAVTFVFGVPRLDEGAAARAVPVNVTIIREGHGVYGTRGEDKCTLDDVRQTALAPAKGARRWRIEARGFCLEPARAIGGPANDAILPSTFDFAGYLTWDLD